MTLYEYGNAGDLYYMAMEYVQGRTLHAEIFDEGRFEERRGIRIAKQICRSLREAHSHGIVHRDLKPDNVLLVERPTDRDRVKVLDFGLAKVLEGELADEDATETGLCMGSPKHMAPEQIVGDTVSAHTDIYALGVLLYEMLTAHSPFDRPTRYQTLVAQVHEPPIPFRELLPDVDISDGMEQIVMKCLQKERHHRFASMDEVLQALKVLECGFRATMSSLSGATRVGTTSITRVPLVPRLGSERASRDSLFPPPSDPLALPDREGASSSPVPKSLPPLPPLPTVSHSAFRKPNRSLLIGAVVGLVGVVMALGVWLSTATELAPRVVPVLAGLACSGAPVLSASSIPAPADSQP